MIVWFFLVPFLITFGSPFCLTTVFVLTLEISAPVLLLIIVLYVISVMLSFPWLAISVLPSVSFGSSTYTGGSFSVIVSFSIFSIVKGFVPLVITLSTGFLSVSSLISLRDTSSPVLLLIVLSYYLSSAKVR